MASAPALNTMEDRIRFALHGHEPAVRFFLLLRDTLHFWDDLIDRDRVITPEHINISMFNALIELPSNPFYRQFQDQLQPVLVNAFANWHAANKFESEQNLKNLEVAFVIRSDYANILIQCAYIVGGYEWMTKMTPFIRSTWTDEDFKTYVLNLQAERDARERS